MDPAPTIPFYKTDNWLENTSDYELILVKNVLVQLFNKTIKEGNGRMYTSQFNGEAVETEISQALTTLISIPLTVMPALGAGMQKLMDMLLLERCDIFQKKVVEVKDEYEQMKGKLQEPWVASLSTIDAPNQTHITLLKDLAGQHATLKEKVKQEVGKELEELKTRIAERINFFEEKDSPDALSLLAHSHDCGIFYLTKNIKNFKERDEIFKKIQSQLSNALAEIRAARENFKSVYLPLDKQINGYWVMGSSMPKAPSSYKAPAPQSQVYPSLPKVFTKQQQTWISQIFEQLTRKTEFLSGMEEEKRIDCDDPFFAPIFKVVYAWTPFNNTIKMDKDSTLISKSKNHLFNIKTATENIKLITKKYNGYIENLPIFYGRGYFAADERSKDRKTYEGASEKEFVTISADWTILSEELKTRIKNGERKSISEQSMRIISKCFDIAQYQVENHLNRYAKNTEECNQLFKDIPQAINTLNDELINFSYSINYYSYLADDFSTDTYANRVLFKASGPNYLTDGPFPPLKTIPHSIKDYYPKPLILD